MFYLIGVVRTGDQVEEAGEGVPVRYGDLPDFTTSRSEVPQQ